MINKRVFLYVSGSDYSALTFEENFNPQKEYELMVKEGVKRKIYETNKYYIEIEIEEFGEVDDEFISFMFDILCDSDQLKDSNIFEVTPID